MERPGHAPLPAHALVPINDRAGQSPVVTTPPSVARALSIPEDAWHRDPDQTMPPGILFIPGDGQPGVTPARPPRRRHWRLQLLVGSIAALLLVGLLISVGPLNAMVFAGSSPFRALAQSVALAPPPAFIDYHVQPGDSLESIAARFGVAVGGIYQLNHLYAGAEAQTGESLHIPTDPAFGANYHPPAALPAALSALPPPTNGGGGCIFCAIAGWTNGAGQPCAVEGTQAITDIARFGLLDPEPGDHWVRGFTSWHNGIDISTNRIGSPILAAQTGVVIFAGWDPYGFGWSVKINHCGGLATSYGHMQRLLVSVGQAVTAGQAIGLQGASGMASGPHLHFMTWWNNTPVDPLCGYNSIAGIAGSLHGPGCPGAEAVPDH